MATTAQKKKNERMNKAMQLHQTYRSQMAVTGQKENDDVINSFLRDSQNYIRESDSSLRRMSWKEANDPDKQNVRKTVSGNMLQRAAQVKTILDGSRSSINPDQYKTLTDYLAAFEDDISAIGKETENVRNFYSKWKSEEEYNADYRRYVEQQRDRAEKSKFDLDAGQKEIDALEAELAQLRTGNNIKAFGANSRPYAAGQTVTDDAQYTTGYGITNNRPYAAGLQVQRENSPVDNRIRELEQQISQKKQYQNQAKQIQQSDAYADTVNNEDFDKYDDYAKSDDVLYNWINDPQYREEYETQHSAMNDTAFQDSPFDVNIKSEFTRKGYDRMNKSEIAIYNYYYAKGGKEAAQKYLDNIQETLNARVAVGMYETVKDDVALEMVFGAAAGINQFGTNAVNNFRFKSDYIPQSAHQIASGMVREDLGEIGKQRKLLGGNTLAQVAYEADKKINPRIKE